jgi:hypothetical protein
MPSNLAPRLTPAELKTLYKLLAKFAIFIGGEQPLAADIIGRILAWVKDEQNP